MRNIPVVADFSSIDDSSPQYKVAIIGGGPGGLFTAWHLASKAGNACKITIYEASERLGGKIVTREFAGAGIYEAGVAEIYDYSALGPDPLRNLIENELELEIKHISGGACILDGKIIEDCEHLTESFGEATQQQVTAFRRKCEEMLTAGRLLFERSRRRQYPSVGAHAGRGHHCRGDDRRDGAPLCQGHGAQRRRGTAAPHQRPDRSSRTR